MINVEVVSDNKHWKKKLKKNSTFFNKLVKFFPKKYQFKNKKVSLTLLLSNNKNIKKLNKKFRKKNKTTDVLSFPFYNSKELKKNIKENRKVYIGDIIININKIKKNLKDKKIFIKNFDKLWIHGLLHLFGYDHKKNKEFKKMSKTETKLLNLISKNAE